MLQELYRQLLEKGRGKNKQPGVIRTKQNWVGGNRPGDAQYVPPPDDEINRLLENLIVFMNRQDVSMPSIRKAGIAHVQFESIHPFYDGNGRIGRMIISLLLSAEGLLKEPLLYLSLYLKMNRYRYYELLQTVREKSDWQQWLIFFCTGVTEVARSALQTAQKLLELFNDDARRIQTVGGRSFGLMIQVHNIFKEKIIVQPKQIVIESRLSPPTVSKILRVLTELGIIKEISGKQRNSVYAYQKYLDILAEGAEPIDG
jgi:Fic family protein